MPAVAPEKEPAIGSDAGYWAEELPDGGARFRAKIGGLHCSLCTGTIEQALGRQDGVAQVAVSLTHEQALPALMQANVGVAMGGTDIAMESADVIILSGRLTSLLVARDISARSYRKTRQNVALAFAFNGIGIPLAATGLLSPVWAMAAMAVSVTAIFANSLWGRPALLFDAVRSVGRHDPERQATATATEVAA